MVVWIPILAGDDREAAEKAAARFSDARVRHYFDRDRALGVELGEALGIGPAAREAGRAHGVAWDVYVVYPKGTAWNGVAPRPSFWMHQLSQVPDAVAPRLDGAALRARVEAAL